MLISFSREQLDSIREKASEELKPEDGPWFYEIPLLLQHIDVLESAIIPLIGYWMNDESLSEGYCPDCKSAYDDDHQDMCSIVSAFKALGIYDPTPEVELKTETYSGWPFPLPDDYNGIYS